LAASAAHPGLTSYLSVLLNPAGAGKYELPSVGPFSKLIPPTRGLILLYKMMIRWIASKTSAAAKIRLSVQSFGKEDFHA
jgi:hypothetical protein